MASIISRDAIGKVSGPVDFRFKTGARPTSSHSETGYAIAGKMEAIGREEMEAVKFTEQSGASDALYEVGTPTASRRYRWHRDGRVERQ